MNTPRDSIARKITDFIYDPASRYKAVEILELIQRESYAGDPEANPSQKLLDYYEQLNSIGYKTNTTPHNTGLASIANIRRSILLHDYVELPMLSIGFLREHDADIDELREYIYCNYRRSYRSFQLATTAASMFNRAYGIDLQISPSELWPSEAKRQYNQLPIQDAVGRMGNALYETLEFAHARRALLNNPEVSVHPSSDSLSSALFHEETVTTDRLSLRSLIDATLLNVPTVVERLITPEQIHHFKRDTVSRGDYRRFMNWLQNGVQATSLQEAVDTIGSDLVLYMRALKKHGIQTETSKYSSIFSILTAAYGLAGGAAALAQSPLLLGALGTGAVISVGGGVAMNIKSKQASMIDLRESPRSHMAYLYSIVKSSMSNIQASRKLNEH